MVNSSEGRIFDGVRHYLGKDGEKEYAKRNSFFANDFQKIESFRVLGDDIRDCTAFLCRFDHPIDGIKQALFVLPSKGGSTRSFLMDDSFNVSSMSDFDLRRLFFDSDKSGFVSILRNFTLDENETLRSFGDVKKIENVRLFHWLDGAVLACLVYVERVDENGVNSYKKIVFHYVDNLGEKSVEKIICSDPLTEENFMEWRENDLFNIENGGRVLPGELYLKLKSSIFPGV